MYFFALKVGLSSSFYRVVRCTITIGKSYYGEQNPIIDRDPQSYAKNTTIFDLYDYLLKKCDCRLKKSDFLAIS